MWRPARTNAALGAQQPYDFAAWPADAVIINLGTNDEGAMNNPPWTDPVTGENHAQRPTPEHLAALEQKAVDVLKTVRAHNPGAQIVWACGMLSDTNGRMPPLLRAAVARYRAETGDGRALYLPLPRRHARDAGCAPAPRRSLPPPGRRNAGRLPARSSQSLTKP